MARNITLILLALVLAAALGACGKTGEDAATKEAPAVGSKQMESAPSAAKIATEAGSEMEQNADAAMGQAGTMTGQAVDAAKEMGKENLGSLADAAKEAVPEEYKGMADAAIEKGKRAMNLSAGDIAAPEVPAIDDAIKEEAEEKKDVGSVLKEKASGIKLPSF